MSVSALEWIESVSQSASGAVERVSVTMLAVLEADLDVNRALALPGEVERGDASPNTQCPVDLHVHFVRRQIARVLGDLVGQLLHPPSAASTVQVTYHNILVKLK